MLECFARLGARPELVHLDQFSGKDLMGVEKKELSDYHILMIPGGFSSGDYVRAGAIWAARMKAMLGDEIEDFVKEGKLVGGVCNGFQVLVEMGLLPGFGRTMTPKPQAVLMTNDSNRFECRPTYLKHVGMGKCAFTKKLGKEKVMMAPSAHAEGRFTFEAAKEKEYLKKLIDSDQLVFRYVMPDGATAKYPFNPNGALFDIAGICNPKGNVFGMMPHPERAYYRHTHPEWTRTGLDKDVGDGRIIFESAVDHIQDEFK